MNQLIKLILDLFNLLIQLLNDNANGSRNVREAGGNDPCNPIPTPSMMPTQTPVPSIPLPSQIVPSNIPATAVPTPTVTAVSCTPTIGYDSSRAPSLSNWLKNTVVPVIKQQYPLIVDRLARPDYVAPCSFTIIVDPGSDGIASTMGTTITLGATYFSSHQNDIGAVVHESVHIMQQYGGGMPGWLTEGIADWARGYIYQDKIYQKPAPGSSYTEGYKKAAYFLNWVQTKYDANLVHKLNVLGHTGRYTSSFWVQSTGKTADQLWSEMMRE